MSATGNEAETELQVQQFIDFANAILPGSTEIISDLKSGEVWLELLNLIQKDTVNPDKIKHGQDLSVKDCKKNFKLLRKTLNKKGIEYTKILDENLEELLDGDAKLHYDVAVWFKEYFEENSDDELLNKIHKDIEEMENDRKEKGIPPAVFILKADDEQDVDSIEESDATAEMDPEDSGVEEENVITSEEDKLVEKAAYEADIEDEVEIQNADKSEFSEDLPVNEELSETEEISDYPADTSLEEMEMRYEIETDVLSTEQEDWTSDVEEHRASSVEESPGEIEDRASYEEEESRSEVEEHGAASTKREEESSREIKEPGVSSTVEEEGSDSEIKDTEGLTIKGPDSPREIKPGQELDQEADGTVEKYGFYSENKHVIIKWIYIACGVIILGLVCYLTCKLAKYIAVVSPPESVSKRILTCAKSEDKPCIKKPLEVDVSSVFKIKSADTRIKSVCIAGVLANLRQLLMTEF